MDTNSKLIVILGPTATGKTKLAVKVSELFNGEIISADSRQVYKYMDIGTGKDKEEYIISGKTIKYHLIDICSPDDEYNLFRFQQDFLNAYIKIIDKNKTPVLCGGTALYIHSVLKPYNLQKVERNSKLRSELSLMPHEQLIKELMKLKKIHNKTDIENKERTIKALEIEILKRKKKKKNKFPKINYIAFGLNMERKKLKEKIKLRLKRRLQEGLIEEVEYLLKKFSPEKLISFGLEYKFVTLYLMGKLNYDDMFQQLNSAIAQFAKRQMTFFRKMEREGIKIHWIDAEYLLDKQLEIIKKYIN